MSAFAQSTAKIAAWNLSGYKEIPAARLDRQVEGLALLDAEIVALVEINPPEALDKLKAGLAKTGVKYQSVLVKQEGNQHIGVLFKEGVQAKNASLLRKSNLSGTDGYKSSHRRALVVDMKVGKFDFKLIVVHLKAGRSSKEQAIRDQQCKVIGKFIRKRRESKQREVRREDILLVGDFNMIPGQDVSNFHHLGDNDLMDFISSWDLQERFSHILSAGRANLLDGFAISRKYSTEYVRGSLRLFPMHWAMGIGRERYRTEVSDHLPFVATFRIDRSRD